MSLPTMVSPTFDVKLPSTGETITFRPFTVKEEKVLLMALEANDQKDSIRAIRQIFENCIQTDIKFEQLAFFDFEYLFLMLRAKSVGETINLQVKHGEGSDCDQETVPVSVNLEEVRVEVPDRKTRVIELTDQVAVKFKYPTIDMVQNIETTNAESMISLMAKCIEVVTLNDDVYADFTHEEAVTFIESVNRDQFKKMTAFFENLPSLQHTVKIKCPKCGEEDTMQIRGLQSFFT